MVFKIGSNTVIDNSANGKFNVSSVVGYSYSQLQSLSGSREGQVVYCTDCKEGLVVWNGSKWANAVENDRIGTVTINGLDRTFYTNTNYTGWTPTLTGNIDPTDSFLYYNWTTNNGTITNGTTHDPTINFTTAGSATISVEISSDTATDSPQSSQATLSANKQKSIGNVSLSGPSNARLNTSYTYTFNVSGGDVPAPSLRSRWVITNPGGSYDLMQGPPSPRTRNVSFRSCGPRARASVKVIVSHPETPGSKTSPTKRITLRGC